MSILNYMKIALAVAILIAFCYIVRDYQHLKSENKRLTSELTTANSTITALDNVAKKNAAIKEKTDGLVDEIEKEPESNDAPTAPVLLNAIDRLR